MKTVAAVLGLCIALTACSGAREQRGSLAKLREAELRVSLKARCHDAGEKASREWREAQTQTAFPEYPMYAFNADLQTCLYADGNVAGQVELRTVVDVYTNQIILEYSAVGNHAVTSNDQPHRVNSAAEFEKRRAALLGFSR
jgi:hypothetical protein